MAEVPERVWLPDDGDWDWTQIRLEPEIAFVRADLHEQAVREARREVLPWNCSELEGWSIVGMNHYFQEERRFLFVALTRDGRCIKAEGLDESSVFERLAAAAKEGE